MVNRRINEDGKVVIAVGQEGSFADLRHRYPNTLNKVILGSANVLMSEDNENKEYDRAITELVMMLMDYDECDFNEVQRMIRDFNKDQVKKRDQQCGYVWGAS